MPEHYTKRNRKAIMRLRRTLRAQTWWVPDPATPHPPRDQIPAPPDAQTLTGLRMYLRLTSRDMATLLLIDRAQYLRYEAGDVAMRPNRWYEVARVYLPALLTTEANNRGDTVTPYDHLCIPHRVHPT